MHFHLITVSGKKFIQVFQTGLEIVELRHETSFLKMFQRSATFLRAVEPVLSVFFQNFS